MRRFFIFLVVTFISIESFSQRITGTVTDTEGQSLPNASVIIGGASQGTTTDEKGNFSIKCKKGELRLVISYMGFDSYDEIHTIGQQDLNLGKIVLFPTSYMSEEVIVKATRSSENTPMTYDSYDSKYLESKNVVQDITYMLNLTPSFVATSEGGYGVGATNFRIRGTDPTRVNVTINGIQLNDAESQSVFWNNMPDFASSVNDIQITRGVGSSTTGTSAFGATLNFLTGNNESKPYGKASIYGGSFNTLKASLSAGTGQMKNGFSFDLRMSKLNSSGYIEGGASDHRSVMLSAAWKRKSSIWKANVIYGKQKTGITWWGCEQEMLNINRTYNPAGEYYDKDGKRQYYKDENDNYQQTHVQLLYSKNFSENLDFNIGLHYTRGDGYYEEYKMNQWYSEYGISNVKIPTNEILTQDEISSDIEIQQTDLIRKKMMANDFYGATISSNYKKGNWTACFGASGNQYLGNHFGNITWMEYAGIYNKDYEWYRNKGQKVDFNVFYKTDYVFFDKLTIYGDLQYKTISYKMSGIDADIMPDGSLKVLNEDLDYYFFNPKGGILFDFSENMNIYASVARSHREPTRSIIKDAVGDPLKTPKPEALTDYEIGYKYKNKIFAGSLNFYFMNYTNQLVPTGELSSTGYDIMTNVEKSYRSGIEISAGVKPLKRLNIEANITLSKNKIKDFTYMASSSLNGVFSFEKYHKPESDIAFSPNIIAAGIISYNVFGNFYLNLTSKYVGKQYFDNTSSENRKLDPYWINNISMDYAIITKHIKEIRIKFQVNNLFNVKYSNDAYGGLWYEDGVEKTWAYYFPQAGTTFMGGVTLSF